MRRLAIQSEIWFICEFLKKGALENRPMNDLLESMDREFEKLPSKTGRPSIPPKLLLWICLVHMFYLGHGDRQQLELLNFNLLIRCLIDRNMARAVWDYSSFSPNRDHLMVEVLILNFFGRLIPVAKDYSLLSDEYFSINGTLVEARAPHKKFRHKYSVQYDFREQADGSRDTKGDVNNITRFSRVIRYFSKIGHLLR
jgi:transposase